MGGAIIGGIVKKGISKNVMISDKNIAVVEALCAKFGVEAARDNKTAARYADVLFLAVKPTVIYSVIEEIKEAVGEETVVVSIAAGQNLEKLERAFEKRVRIVRVMPNTPALVGEGMSALCANEEVTAEDLETVTEIFNSLGRAECVEEYMMDAVTAVSGSSPAYVFMLLEAMADAAVMGGMPRDKAYTFAAQAVLGSAKMALESGKHPGELKDMVCSPAGTTIEAVRTLEKKGFRSAVIEAMNDCMKKSGSM